MSEMIRSDHEVSTWLTGGLTYLETTRHTGAAEVLADVVETEREKDEERGFKDEGIKLFLILQSPHPRLYQR